MVPYASGSRVLNDTWLWDGHGWSQANPVASPPARQGAVMSYDPATKQILLFGGTQPRTGAGGIALDDTWTYDGTTWTQRHPAHQPPWSSGMAMSYDPRSQSVLLLTLPSVHPNIDVSPGTYTRRGPEPFGTWRWAGTDWNEIATPSAPLFSTSEGIIYTSPRLIPLADGAGLLLDSWAIFDHPLPIGTVHAQTWTWDGSRSTKHPTSPCRSAPTCSP